MTTLGSPVLSSSFGVKEIMSMPSLSSIQEKPVKNRCQHDGCKKKLSLTDFPCKCGKTHCATHRPSEVHSCSYDYKGNFNKVLQSTMEKVAGEKLAKI